MSGGKKNAATEQTQVSYYKPTDEQEQGYSWLGANLAPLMYTPQSYFPGQGYVSPSGLTQQGIEGLQGVNQGYQRAADIMSGGQKYWAGARDDMNAAAQGQRDTSGWYNQAAGLAGQAIPAWQRASAGYDQAANALRGAQPYFDQAASSMESATGNFEPYLQQQRENYKFLSNAADVANNPHVQKMLGVNQSEVMKNLTEKMLPGLQKNALSVNALGSDRLGLAQGRAMGDTSQALASQNARTMMDAYSQGLSTQTAALGMTGQMLANERMPSEARAMAARLRGEGADYMGRAAGMGQQSASMLDQATRAGQQRADLYGQGADAMGRAGDYMKGAGGLSGLYGEQLARAAALRGQGAGTLLQGGQQVEGYQQQALQDAMARWQHQFDEPWQRIQNVSGLMGLFDPLGVQVGQGRGIAPNPSYRSPFQTGLGGLMTIGGMLMGPLGGGGR